MNDPLSGADQPQAEPVQTPTDAATDDAAVMATEPDASDVLVDHVDCRQCGYDLAGLSQDATCPECGTSIAWSLEGDLLVFSDPRWLGQTLRGLQWYVASLILMVVLGVLAFAGFFLGARLLGPSQLGGAMMMFNVGSLAVTAIILGVMAVGYYRMTAIEPGETNTKRLSLYRLTRIMTLSSIAVAIVVQLGQIGFALVLSWFNVHQQQVFILTQLAELFNSLVGTIAFLFFLWLCRDLALRLPNQSLARNIKIAFCLNLAFIPALIVIHGGQIVMTLLAFNGNNDPTVQMVIGGIFIVIGLAAIAVVIYEIVLLVWFYRGLTRIVRRQREFATA